MLRAMGIIFPAVRSYFYLTIGKLLYAVFASERNAFGKFKSDSGLMNLSMVIVLNFLTVIKRQEIQLMMTTKWIGYTRCGSHSSAAICTVLSIQSIRTRNYHVISYMRAIDSIFDWKRARYLQWSSYKLTLRYITCNINPFQSISYL